MYTRQEVLDAIPECESHGSCIPHAMDWIKEAKTFEQQLQAEKKKVEDIMKALDENEKMHDYSIATETIRVILTK